MKRFQVYFLECSDGTIYTGVTSQLHIRLWQHETGFYPESYTAKRLPVRLLGHIPFPNAIDAIHFEKQVKKWRASKKRAIALGNVLDVHFLAKKYTPRK